MSKITIDGSKCIYLALAIFLLLSAVIAGCVTKPDVQLDITASAASGLVITHKGGDPLILKDEKITVKREVNGKLVDGLDSVPLYGATPEFQDAPAVQTLAAGQKIRHTWKETLLLREVLLVTIQDAASGRVIADIRVTVM